MGKGMSRWEAAGHTRCGVLPGRPHVLWLAMTEINCVEKMHSMAVPCTYMDRSQRGMRMPYREAQLRNQRRSFAPGPALLPKLRGPASTARGRALLPRDMPTAVPQPPPHSARSLSTLPQAAGPSAASAIPQLSTHTPSTLSPHPTGPEACLGAHRGRTGQQTR